MKIVVGLGNPGKRYENTRHNVGFKVVDCVAEDMDCRIRRSLRFGARIGKGVLEGEQLCLVKPETYMNRSGRAVGSVLRYWKKQVSDLIVIVDDADLDVGRIRIKAGGSSGGHRGLDSIMESVGDGGFVRVRIGIGRAERDSGLTDHVLKSFSSEERPAIDEAVVAAGDAVKCIVLRGVDAAMNRFNGRR